MKKYLLCALLFICITLSAHNSFFDSLYTISGKVTFTDDYKVTVTCLTKKDF